jgi:hypothetical protein
MFLASRVTPPMVLREAAERFDEQILECAATKLDLPNPRVDRKTFDLLRLPFKHFGLALRPHTLSSPTAYFSSLALSAHAICESRPPATVHAAVRDTDTYFHLSDTFEVLCAAGVDPSSSANRHCMPRAPADFWETYAGERPVKPHLQRHLTHQIEQRAYLRVDGETLEILDVEPDREPQLYSGSDPDIAAAAIPSWHWLTVVPYCHETNINSHHFKAAIRHRYNFPAATNLPPV